MQNKPATLSLYLRSLNNRLTPVLLKWHATEEVVAVVDTEVVVVVEEAAVVDFPVRTVLQWAATAVGKYGVSCQKEPMRRTSTTGFANLTSTFKIPP